MTVFLNVKKTLAHVIMFFLEQENNAKDILLNMKIKLKI